MSTAEAAVARESAWVHRLLLWGAIGAVPLILVGGTITTVGAGMAVQGWWNAEGHFMPLFPLDKWFRDFGTFVEHTHRQIGMVVGLCVLAAAVVATLKGSGRQRLAATVALLAVVGQGSLGGFRVLENSPQLAFLHGVAAQGVFAVLLGATLASSPAWRAAPRSRVRLTGTQAVCWLLSLAVYGQITLGAWYRHALRNGGGLGLESRLWTHLGVGLGVLGLVILAARALKRAAASDGALAPLRRASLWLHALVGLQVLLGFVAWLAYAPAPPGGQKEFPPLELTSAALHVMGGALLLATAVRAALWCGRLAPAQGAGSVSVENVSPAQLP
ncbi:MAG: COX15/CtaA family protein [Planctomycetota bacterium]